jgi:hypothetical protein
MPSDATSPDAMSRQYLMPGGCNVYSICARRNSWAPARPVAMATTAAASSGAALSRATIWRSAASRTPPAVPLIRSASRASLP